MTREPANNITLWVSKHAYLIPTDTTVMDLACGGGRHTGFFLARGNQVIAVDKDTSGLTEYEADPACEIINCNLEAFDETLALPGADLPFRHANTQSIVVVNYLHRPLLAALARALPSEGILIYQTFMEGNEKFGRPRRPEFLLRPGELARTFNPQFDQIDFFEGMTSNPMQAMIQCYCGRKK